MARLRPDERLVLAVQAAYFLATGVWALVSDRSFEAVTGRKRDDWLVKTLAAFILPVGATLACAARRPASPEVRLLGGGSAAALGGASVRIPRVCCSTV